MNPLDVWYNIKMNVKKQIFKGTLYAVVAGCMFEIGRASCRERVFRAV